MGNVRHIRRVEGWREIGRWDLGGVCDEGWRRALNFKFGPLGG
jgi:hypothetical protein